MLGMKNMLHVIIEASGGLLEATGRRRAHRMALFSRPLVGTVGDN